MNYRLLVLDLDGTLTNSQKEISPRNKETLIRLQQKGVSLVLASGRPLYGIVPLAEELRMSEFDGYILAYNGGEIVRCRTGEKLYEKVLPNDVIPVLYETAGAYGLSILTHDGPVVITEHGRDKYVAKEAFLNRMEVREVSNFPASIPLPVPKCLIVGEPDKLIPVERELSARLKDRINVFRSEPYFLELVPPGVDKALSLAVLLEKTGMKREETVAMGDGYNDLSLIRFAGMGVAMGNAQDTVKDAADYITLTNDEDGVAVAVEKLFGA